MAAMLPLLYLLVRAFDGGSGALPETLRRARTWELAASSITLAAAVTLTCVVLGTASAWIVTHAVLPVPGMWLALCAIPLAVPSYVAAYGWLATSPGLHGFLPSWLVLSAVSVPYVTLPAAAAMRAADPEPAEMARSLGCGPVIAWRTATLPQVLPAITAGGLLVSLYVLSDYGAVAMLRHEVFTFAIARQYGSFVGRDTATSLALVLVVLAILLVVGERVVRGRANRWRVGRGARRLTRPIPLGRWTAPAIGVLLLAPTVAALVPTVALFGRLLEGTARTLDTAELMGAVLSTCLVAAGGAALAIALALPIGLLAARHRGRFATAVEIAGFTGHALPGIVVALSLVFFSLAVVPGLYQSVAVLVFAYAVLFLPKAIGAARSSIEQVPPSLAEVTRSLGIGAIATQLRVTARIASPGVMAGALLVMLTAMKELPATLLLRPTGLDTLATEIWSRTASAAYGSAAPYALTLLAVACVPAFLLTRAGAWEDGR